jgi:hypothetical protein
MVLVGVIVLVGVGVGVGHGYSVKHSIHPPGYGPPSIKYNVAIGWYAIILKLLQQELFTLQALVGLLANIANQSPSVKLKVYDEPSQQFIAFTVTITVVGVTVGVKVGVIVLVGVIVFVGVNVGVTEVVGVIVLVGVIVFVGVNVNVGVTVGVGVGQGYSI